MGLKATEFCEIIFGRDYVENFTSTKQFANTNDA